MTCRHCGQAFERAGGRGRPRDYCSRICRRRRERRVRAAARCQRGAQWYLILAGRGGGKVISADRATAIAVGLQKKAAWLRGLKRIEVGGAHATGQLRGMGASA